MKKITSEQIPIKMWAKEIESGALDQAKNLANLPFAIEHIALMPDTHQGYGMPIGGVMAARQTIVPNAVGVDIGCGMCAVRTSLTEVSTETLKKIMGQIREQIPVGKNHHKEDQDQKLMPKFRQEKGIDIASEYPIVFEQYGAALRQLGTLGGGNHFIEIQKGDDGHIWIMIHSGSRNIGYQVAQNYNRWAKEVMEAADNPIPPSFDLAFFPVNAELGKKYIAEMQYCVEFALANRKLMMDRVIKIFEKEYEVRSDAVFSTEAMINIAHNYAALEEHYGEKVWVHRKGATSAKAGELGIIPGSQGSSSYIVTGLGNKESFESCSHGAGRQMSRTRAKEELSVESEAKKLDDMGVIHAIRGPKDLDEAPGAYKDIDEVMAHQRDLVKIKVKLTPLAVVKG